MPIVRKQTLHLSDLVPILRQHGFSPVWVEEGEGIVVGNNYVSICNTNELFIQGTEEFAKIVQENWAPYGDELTINLYPPRPMRTRKKTLWRRVLDCLNEDCDAY